MSLAGDHGRSEGAASNRRRQRAIGAVVHERILHRGGWPSKSSRAGAGTGRPALEVSVSRWLLAQPLCGHDDRAEAMSHSRPHGHLTDAAGAAHHDMEGG